MGPPTDNPWVVTTPAVSSVYIMFTELISYRTCVLNFSYYQRGTINRAVFFVSLNLLIGWQFSIWICYKPFFPSLYNCQLLYFCLLALSTAVQFFPRHFFSKYCSFKDVSSHLLIRAVPAIIRRCDDLPATIIHVPVAAVLVLNTPDDGRLRPKHVE